MASRIGLRLDRCCSPPRGRRTGHGWRQRRPTGNRLLDPCLLQRLRDRRDRRLRGCDLRRNDHDAQIGYLDPSILPGKPKPGSQSPWPPKVRLNSNAWISSESSSACVSRLRSGLMRWLSARRWNLWSSSVLRRRCSGTAAGAGQDGSDALDPDSTYAYAAMHCPPHQASKGGAIERYEPRRYRAEKR